MGQYCGALTNYFLPEKSVRITVQLPVICDAWTLIWRHYNDFVLSIFVSHCYVIKMATLILLPWWRICIMKSTSFHLLTQRSQYSNIESIMGAVPIIIDDGMISTINPAPWWRHQIETFSALLAIYAGNSPVTGEFPAQRPVTRSFDVFFDLCLNKRLSKHSWDWLFGTPSHPLWRHCNANKSNYYSQASYEKCRFESMRECKILNINNLPGIWFDITFWLW